MPMRRVSFFIAVSSLIMTMVFSNAFSADQGSFSTAPKTRDGKKWRIGYFEGGEYIDYQKTLVATVQGLMRLGWLENAPLPALKGEDTGALWAWLRRPAAC